MTSWPDADLDLLRRAEATVVGRFADASNATLLVHLRCDGEPELDLPADGPTRLEELPPDRLAVYKPKDGEAPLWDFPDGTLHLREVAAFEVDALLGFGMVPATILRDDLPYGTGSLQRYVAHDPQRHWFWIRDNLDEGLSAQARRMVLFDLIVENADRKGGHVLLDEDDRMWLVDHGVCFHPDPHVRTVVWDFAGTAVPEADRAAAARLADLLAPDGEGRRRLDGLLGEDEIVATRQRALQAADLQRFPAPSGPRPFPWPPL